MYKSFQKTATGGGVSIYIKNDIKFINRPDLEYFDAEMESLFIEIDKNVFNLSSNVVVGVIYRMPNTCMEIFNDRMSDIMNIVQRERKICYFHGDLNVDLLKHESHQSTAAFLDSLYSYNVFPLITKPTGVTRESATLIDHVLANNFDINSKYVQGILCTSISDHYAIFILLAMQELHLPMTYLYSKGILLKIIWQDLPMKWKMWTGNS